MRARSVALVVVLAACARDPGGVVVPAAAISYVDGAVEPLLTRGRTVVVEGHGFGATRGSGSVTFRRADGTSVPGVVTDTAWSEFAIEVEVPPEAVTGGLVVTTDVGHRLEAPIFVVPAVAFDAGQLTWQPRAGFPRAPVGVALAVAEFASPTGITTTLFAAGGAEPLGGDSVFTPERGVHVAKTLAGGDLAAWVRQPESNDAANRSLPVPRAFAAAAVATRHNARLRLTTGVLYVVGGVDANGRAQKTVYGADVSADGVLSRFVPLEPLPVPVAGASAIARRGSLYIIGGADSAGRPLTTVFVARIAPSGQLDGWYRQPTITGPRAYGGAALLDRRVLSFGGVDSIVPPGGGLDASPPRLAAGDTSVVSRRSGFFTSGWGSAGALLPEPRSQFATLAVGNTVLLVGGMYAGAATNAAETLAASIVGDSLGPFTGPVGTTTIAGQGGGTLVGPAAATWRETSGTHRGIVLGGMDLATRLRTTGVWGF